MKNQLDIVNEPDKVRGFSFDVFLGLMRMWRKYQASCNEPMTEEDANETRTAP